ncbi:MAG: 30S ribosomal protein S19e [archaeon]
MTTAYDVDGTLLIKKVSEELKKEDKIKPPAWAPFVKTASFKDRPPDQPDWWYIRTASVLRRLYASGPLGVRNLKKEYGGRKNCGSAPEKHGVASGNILRKILQQLESAGYAKKLERNRQVIGRIITPKGTKLLDSAAHQIKNG